MFRIESYITSIILANADRYIKNFRKQDAQLSLWEGDATFHNIELNNEALNEELQLPFIFTSGYIHELAVHVPWTKLNSEHVTVSINTIECVVKLRTWNDVKSVSRKAANTNYSSAPYKDSYKPDNAVPPPSYISSLTSKIMNNLSIQCKNFILKFVEEDIVLSMNIEKLILENVNQSWQKAFTEINSAQLLVRKIIDLSGVTICLDKQNSSGRIETYLEPILYRCPVLIRICKNYESSSLKNPVSTRINIFSLKMNFTITESQILMLLKLLDLITMGREKSKDTTDSGDFDDNVSHSSVGCIDFGSSKASDTAEEQPSWSYWLWNMMPSLLPPENEDDNAIAKYNEEKFSILNIGFYTESLEIVLKFSSTQTKKNLRSDYKSAVKGTFTGFLFELVNKNSDWMNVQLGTSSISVEPTSDDSIFREHYSTVNQYVIAGNSNIRNYLNGTLFDDNTIRLRRKNSFEENVDEPFPKQDISFQTENLFQNLANSDNNYSVETHLTIFTENTLLDKTPAFAIDYLKYNVTNKSKITMKDTINDAEEDNDDTNKKDNSESVQKKSLLRIVFSSTIVHITHGLLQRLQVIHKILKSSNYFGNFALEQQHSKIVGNNQNDCKLLAYPSRVTQYTLFDLIIHLYPASPTTSESYKVITQEQPIFLIISLKCIDAKTINHVYPSNIGNTLEFYQCDSSIRVIGVNCDLITGNSNQAPIIRIDKFECDYRTYNPMFSQILQQMVFEISKVEIETSRPSLLLSYYIVKSLWYELLSESLNVRTHCSLQIFNTSLIDDVNSTEYGRIVLNAVIENISLNYKSRNELISLKGSVGDCIVRIYNKDPKIKKSTILLVCGVKNKSYSTPCLQVTMQHVKTDTKERILSFPKCLFFELTSMCFNADPLFFNWTVYKPRTNTNLQEGNKFKRELTTSRNNNLGRKVSESSGSSYSKRIGTVLSFYSKPKESVHSSFEQELTSAQPDLESAPTYLSPAFVKSSSVGTSKKQLSFKERILIYYEQWKDLIVYGEVMHFKMYIPTQSLVTLDSNYKSQTIDLTIKDSIRRIARDNKKFGILVCTLKTLRIKCDVPLSVLEYLPKTIPVSLTNTTAFCSSDKNFFPWTVEITNLQCAAESENCTKSLLSPFSANCTVSISTREHENKEPYMALYVHFDIQPVTASVNNEQISLITNVISMFSSIYNEIYNKKMSNEKLPNNSSTEISNIREDAVATDDAELNGGKLKKVTGWVQCTLTKLTFSIYNSQSIIDRSVECTKLVTEMEDSIMSLEFDDVYHKMKLKISAFCVNHYIRDENSKLWIKGPFSGIVLKRRNSELQSDGSVTTEESNDRFLLATVTRARYSNLQTRLSANQPTSSAANATSSSDQFIMEMILNLCPLDLILEAQIIQTYLSIILPLFYGIIELIKEPNEETERINESLTEEMVVPSLTFPLVYIDTRNTRIFLPSENLKADISSLSYDTVILEIGSVCVDCELQNPIIRKSTQTVYKNYSELCKPVLSPSVLALNDRQYQIQLNDVFVSTGMWFELEDLIIKENFCNVHALSAGILQENPAVMWNQGSHPEDRNESDLKFISSVFTKFSCSILIAPPITLPKSSRIACGAVYEISIPFNLSITLSLSQLILFGCIVERINQQLLLFSQRKQLLQDKVQTPDFTYSSSSSSQSTFTITDSGIESVGRSSVESSMEKNLGGLNQETELQEQKYSLNSECGSNISKTKRNNKYITNRNVGTVDTEIFISVADITVILYIVSNNSNKHDAGTSTFKPLSLIYFSQPHWLITMKHDYHFYQVSFFKAKLKLPSSEHTSSDQRNFDENDFPFICLETKKLNKDEFTGIPYPCFLLELANSNNKNSRKIDIKVGQPVSILFSAKFLNILDDAAVIFIEGYRKYLNAVTSRTVRIEQFSKKEKLIANEGKPNSCCTDLSVSTGQLALIFKSDNHSVLLSATNSSSSVSLGSPMINLNRETAIRCKLEGISLTIFQTFLIDHFDISSDNWTSLINLSSVLVMQPTNVDFQRTFSTTAQRDAREYEIEYFKFFTSDVILNVTPFYVECISRIIAELERWSANSDLLRNLSSNDITATVHNNVADDNYSQLYNDDLRAGIFQYIKLLDGSFRMPLPYELVLCNCSGNPYMIWRYPQPRTINKLYLYPILTETSEVQALNQDIHCELQYYNELTLNFVSYAKFKLSTENIQKIPLPSNRADMQVSTCWCIKLQCPYIMFTTDGQFQNCFDINALAGCIRLDSLYRRDFVPDYEIFGEISSVQVHFSASPSSKLFPASFDKYKIDNPSIQHNLVSIKCDKCLLTVSKRPADFLIKFSSTIRTYVLNYLYLMYQTLVEPFPVHVIFHKSQYVMPKLSIVSGNVVIRFSQNVSHTLSIFHWLWSKYNKSDDFSYIKITAPYIICNNTNCIVTISQDSTKEEICVKPNWCYLYAWYSPFSVDMLRITILFNSWKFVSSPVNINKYGKCTVKCTTDDNADTCLLLITITEISPIARKVVLEGHVSVFNQTDMEIDLLTIATEPDSSLNSSNSSSNSFHPMCSSSLAFTKSLSSVIIPLNYNLSMKVRNVTASSDTNCAHWSGLIPIKIFQKNNNKSWLVKVPMKECKDHFQSIWCDVIQEFVDQNPRLLILFKPLCLVQSYLPWKTYLKVLDEKGAVVSNILVLDKGSMQDLVIPDTVTLDNFCIQWKQREDVQNSVSLTLVKPFSKPDFNCSILNIEDVIAQIESSKCSEKWQFIDSNMSHLRWMTDNNCSVTPHFKINPKQCTGIGLYIEIYPQIIITNTLGRTINVVIDENSYRIDHSYIFIPPIIENELELIITDNDGCNYSSGPLNLSESNISKGSTNIPMNGFTSVLINCDQYITFVNIKSKNLNDMRIIDICSPYVIINYSSQIVHYSTFALCKTNSVSYTLADIPGNLHEDSVQLSIDDSSFSFGNPIISWKKIGDGDTQILPYLIFTFGPFVSCPVRICDLSERISTPLLFSTTVVPNVPHPSLCITAQHKDGQVFISLHDEPMPHITIHNVTGLTLNVASSKTEQGNQLMLDSTDWKWKFYSMPNSASHYRIHPNFRMQEKSKKFQPHLVFALRNDYLTKDTKWSRGIRLESCRKQLVILALSQQHVSVSIYKDNFTFVVLIELATVTDLPCTNVRKQLLQKHFGIEKENSSRENVKQNVSAETNGEEEPSIPLFLQNYYNAGVPDVNCNIQTCIKAISVILVSDNEISNNREISALNVDHIVVYTSEAIYKEYEVRSETKVTINVGSYQLDNEEHRYSTYDFPVMLINKPNAELSLDTYYKYPSEDNIYRLIELSGSSELAVNVVTNVVLDQFRNFDVRDVEIKFSHQFAYIEDKYVIKLKSLLESIFSSAIKNDISVSYLDVCARNNISDVKAELRQVINNESIRYSFSAIDDVLSKCDFVGKRIPSRGPASTSSKSVNVSECEETVDGKISQSANDQADVNRASTAKSVISPLEDRHVISQQILTATVDSHKEQSINAVRPSSIRDYNRSYTSVPKEISKLARAVVHPIKLRSLRISNVHCTVSIHTSTAFYVALDHSPLRFSDFTRQYLIISPYELGQTLTAHYIVGAIYGSGWAISSLEFVGSPGGLARTVSTGIKDFVSLPIYGISSGPQGFVLGVVHGSASLLKHLMAGTLTSVTKFAGSWARTLDRFTLDSDDLIQSEVVRRRPPTNIKEGIVQGLTEFGISLLGGISGIAHHPLQYAISESTDRSLFGSVSLGLVGMITRPLSGAAELVARTGQGILSHVGWNMLPKTKQTAADNNALLFNTILRCRWKNVGVPHTENILYITDGAIIGEKIKFTSLIFTHKFLYINEAETDMLVYQIKIRDYEFYSASEDSTLITACKSNENYQNPEKYSHIYIRKFIEDANKSLGIEMSYYNEPAVETQHQYKFHVNPDIRYYIMTLIKFLKSSVIS